MDTTFSAAAASNLPWRGWNLVCVMPPCNQEPHKCQYWEFHNTYGLRQPDNNLEGTPIRNQAFQMWWKNPETISDHEKEETPPKRKEKTRPQNRIHEWFEQQLQSYACSGTFNTNMYTLTTYLKIPTDFISSQQWAEKCQTLTSVLNFCHKTGGHRKTQLWCWLVQETE